MKKYYNKDIFNSTLRNTVGKVHFFVQATECNKGNVSLKIGLANSAGPVYIFDTVILNKGDRVDIRDVEFDITDWVHYV